MQFYRFIAFKFSGLAGYSGEKTLSGSSQISTCQNQPIYHRFLPSPFLSYIPAFCIENNCLDPSKFPFYLCQFLLDAMSLSKLFGLIKILDFLIWTFFFIWKFLLVKNGQGLGFPIIYSLASQFGNYTKKASK